MPMPGPPSRPSRCTDPRRRGRRGALRPVLPGCARLSDKRLAAAGCVVFAIALLADLAWLGLFARFDHGLSDALLHHASRSHPPDPEIVLLVADERSVEVLGEEVDRWPWPREVFGEVAQAIAAQKPAAIVFDMVHADPDRSRPKSGQEAMSRMLSGLPNVYIAMVRGDPANDPYGVSLRALAPYIGVDPGARPDAKANILLPRALSTKVWRLGAINFHEDADGVGGVTGCDPPHGWRCPRFGAGSRTTSASPCPRAQTSCSLARAAGTAPCPLWRCTRTSPGATGSGQRRARVHRQDRGHRHGRDRPAGSARDTAANTTLRARKSSPPRSTISRTGL